MHTSHSVAATNEVSVIMDLMKVAAIYALLVEMKHKRGSRKYWVHPIVSNRLLCGAFHTLFLELKEHPEIFFDYFSVTG